MSSRSRQPQLFYRFTKLLASVSLKTSVRSIRTSFRACIRMKRKQRESQTVTLIAQIRIKHQRKCCLCKFATETTIVILFVTVYQNIPFVRQVQWITTRDSTKTGRMSIRIHLRVADGHCGDLTDGKRGRKEASPKRGIGKEKFLF